MASPLTPERQAELDNALAASEELARTGKTTRRCLRCGGELRLIDHGTLSGYEVVCEPEHRVILTARG
jgi:hypothetical protein